MRKTALLLATLLTLGLIALSRCAVGYRLPEDKKQTDTPAPKSTNDGGKTGIGMEGDKAGENVQGTRQATVTTPATGQAGGIDYSRVMPDETGSIMIVMFHYFVESYNQVGRNSGEYTTTFDEFRELLRELYKRGYRLLSVNDYINNNISTQAGCIPIIFTFDDGTPGQFNMVEENGKLVVNRRSAVGILEEFNIEHPEFGQKGMFYISLGASTFEGKGTLAERLEYLKNRGFEIGNHTLIHARLNELKSAERIQQEIGGNQKRMYELIPGYKFISLSLPYGLQPPKEIREFMIKGKYEGIEYENLSVMLVGAEPAPSPATSRFNPLSIPRVRAKGMKAVQYDLEWWLHKLTRESQYVSDGDPDTISVPRGKEGEVDIKRLGNKKLNVY